MNTEEPTTADVTDPEPTLARRGLVLGAGAAALVAGTLGGALPARADSAGSKGPDVGASAALGPAAAELGSPVASTIGSPPISGYTYRHVSWLDFQPESGPATRTYGGRGAYSSGTSPYMWATVDIPAGALVRDIEWYAYNDSGSAVTGLGRLWAAGTGTLFSTLADTSIPSSSATQARRSVVPAANYGPHPLGTKISLGLNTAGAGTVQVNGARVGFTVGAGAVGLLPSPIRAYDSRVSGGKLPAGTIRTITLSSTYIRPGTAGVVLNVAVVDPAGAGFMRVYPGNVAAPASSTINFEAGQDIANMVFVGVSSSRQIKVYANKSVHVVIDITGTIG